MTDAGLSIADFLRARHDEAEATTRDLLYWAQQTILTLKDPKLLGKYIPGWHDWPKVEQMCRDRLADLDSKRAILAEHAPDTAGLRTVCAVCADPPVHEATWHDWPCLTVRLLAAPFAAHPDYQEAWKP